MRAQGQPDMGAAALRELRKGWISARSASQVIAERTEQIGYRKLMQTYPNLTDVHATQDEPLMIRAGGALKKLRETAGKDFFTALFTSYVNEDRMTAYKKEGALDTAFSLGNTRFRLHIYKSGGKPAAAIRVLPELSALLPTPTRLSWTNSLPLSTALSSSQAPREAARARRSRTFS